MKYVVTGGLGFIGKNICKSLLQDNLEVLVIDKISAVSDQSFYKNELRSANLLCCDISSKIASDAVKDGDIVINCAAESHVDKSFEDPLAFTNENVTANHKFIENLYLKKMKNLKILHFSTDEVYGESLKSHKSEEDVFSPTNPYAATKAGMDLIIQSYIKSFDLPIKIVRPNNIYGPRQYFEKLIPKLFYCATRDKEFTIHGSGESRRHFLHTNDVYSALKAILMHWEDDSIAYNLASNDEYSVLELIDKVRTLFPSFKVKNVDNRPFNDGRYLINDEKIRSLGWAPVEDFDTRIAEISRERIFYL